MPTRRAITLALVALSLLGLQGCDANRLLGIPTVTITRVDVDTPDAGDAGTGSDTADADDVGDAGGIPDAAPSPDSGTPPDASRPDADDDTFFEWPDVGPNADVPVFVEPPIIEVIYPATGSTEGGDLVVIEGARFGADVEVLFDGNRAPTIDLIDQYQLAAFTPPGVAGTVTVKVTTAGGSASVENGFTYVAPLRVDAVTPDVGQVSGRYYVELHGQGFAREPRVLFGDREALDVTLIDDRTLRVQVPPGSRAGAVDVVAFDTDLALAAGAFRYVDRPSLNAVVPSLGPLQGGTPVRLDGVGIDADCDALFAGNAVDIVIDGEGWPSVIAPAAPPGPADVAIDCGERGADILAEGYLYVADAGPRLGTVWPGQGFVTGGAVVSIDGIGLSDTSRVTFRDRDASIVRARDGVVDVLLPASDAAGPVDVVLQVGAAELRLDDGFVYTDRPAFDRLAPDAGPVEGGWTTVVYGSGFDAVDALLLDGRDVDIFGRSDTALSIRIEAGAAGPGVLRARLGALVFDTGLTVTRTGERRFDAIFPTIGSMSGGTVVYVSGEGLTPDCRVTLDGIPAATTLRSTSLIAAVTPAHAAGSVQVEVVDCGDPWRSPTPFRYVDPTRIPGGVGGGELDGELRVSVIESGSEAPLEGATVMVRLRDSSPYVALTDAAGLATFIGEDLVGPQTITAFAEGRSAETYVNVDAAEVTLVLAAIPETCDPLTDPDCVPPPPLENGYIIGFLTGLDKVTDPPPGASLYAEVQTTRLVPGYTNPDPGPDNTLTDNGAFALETRRGDLALIALCGYRFDDTGEFVPLSMGVERNIQMRPGEEYRTTIDCNIPLNRDLTVKLRNAPELTDDPARTFPGRFRARLVFDFGGEGVFESIPGFDGSTAVFTGGGFPELRGDLAGVRFDVIAGAYPTAGNIPFAESYLRRRTGYDDTATMPPLLAVPEFVYPSTLEPYLTEGYVEWRYDTDYAIPDLYYITASSPAPGFPSWTLFVPGDQASFHFADFPEFSEVFGFIPGPDAPEGTLSLYVRAVDLDVFSYGDFTRFALRSANWTSLSANYGNFSLQLPVEGEVDEPTE